ncbi:hypothetical protein [Roseimarinus sediminis]|uniref:hypothetical protein n=1 Tax=Roseimarinus sediminis TaxID=1610899 RepID=UPI003D1E4728
MSRFYELIDNFTEWNNEREDGYFLLDSGKVIEFEREKLMYFVGNAGCGKTTFFLHIFKTFLELGRCPISFISTTDSEERIFKSFFELFHTPLQPEQRILNISNLDELKKVIGEHHHSHSIDISHVDNWTALKKSLLELRDYRYIFIDNLNMLVNHLDSDYESITINQILFYLKKYAVKYKLCIIVSNHLIEYVDFFNDSPKVIYSKCLSNEIGDFADEIYGLYRDKYFTKCNSFSPISYPNQLNLIPLKYYCYSPHSFYHFNSIANSK